jgi:hypothetical protein
VLSDVLNNTIGNQIPNWIPVGNSVAAIGRANRKCRYFNESYSPGRNLRYFQSVARSAYGYEVSQVPKLGCLMPRKDLSDCIAAGYEKQLSVWILRL